MTRRVPRFTPPTWFGKFSETNFDTWRNSLIRLLTKTFNDLVDQSNTQTQTVGAELDSTGANTTLKISAAIHPVSGTGSIQYILPPTDLPGVSSVVTVARNVSGFTGPVFFLPMGAWTLVNTGSGTGRIGINSTAVVGRVMTLVLDDAGKWWPSY